MGINGNLYFGDFKKFFKEGTFLNKFFSEIDTNVELARGSVVLDGLRGAIHFKGEKTNPFEGTPLEKLQFLNPKMEVSGSISNLRTSPQFRINYQAANLAGPLQNVGLFLNNNGATFRGSTDILGQQLFVYGSINTSGNITLDGTLRIGGSAFNNSTGSLGAGVYFHVHGQASLSAVTFRASTDLYAWVNALSYDSSGRATGFTGELSVAGKIDLGLTGSSFSFSADADFILYILGAASRQACPSRWLSGLTRSLSIS